MNANFSYLIADNTGAVELGIAYGFENRFGGGYYDANFLGESCVFKVSGLNPSLFLIIPQLTVKQGFLSDTLGLLLNYQAALNTSFYDQSISLQLLY
ncbi:MAG: hypothetical protein JSR76_03270 [Verrucomicrobia bacterium]|nr:hypothetical protein [Verrucomicrobiota bacterium]